MVVDRLKLIYAEREASATQRHLFEGLTEQDSTRLLLLYDKEADKEFEIRVIEALEELLIHRPIQQVLGFAWFCERKFKVSKDVLIPRPETEQLVKMIVNHQLQNNQTTRSILDIGTGSGVIAISLNKLLSVDQTVGIDISEKAIEIAKQNAELNNANVTFIIQDLFSINNDFWSINHVTQSINQDTLSNKQFSLSISYFDVIVSNPPYVKNSEMELMSKNVLDFEPHIALFVKDQDPLLYYKAAIDYAMGHLSKDGILWFEINETEGLNLLALLNKKGFNGSLFNDFNDKPRFISAKRI